MLEIYVLINIMLNLTIGRFDQLEGRVFYVEQTLDNDLKTVTDALEQHKI